MTSRASMRNVLAKKSTSLGLKPWMWIGWLRLMYLQQVEIPLERDVRVVPALHQDLDAAQRLGFVDLGADLLERQRLAFVVLRAAVERAEAAVGDADVRVVDVAVDDVRDDAVRMLLAAHAVGLGAELEQRGVGVEVEEVACVIVSGARIMRRDRTTYESMPFGTSRPRAATEPRAKNSVSPARCWYDSP